MSVDLPPSGPTPATLAELQARAAALGGVTLGQIAARLQRPLPRRAGRHKGWAGMLIEAALGAASGSSPVPDFPGLGVELKTLPITARGTPRESTFVCAAPLDGRRETWETSSARAKLACVLWVPLEADAAIPAPERRVGTPFLWRPDPDEEAQLRLDWEEIMEAIVTGRLDRISAHHGRWLQLRPKGPDAAALTRGFDADGQPAATLPRGFYLRARFTARLLARRGGTGTI